MTHLRLETLLNQLCHDTAGKREADLDLQLLRIRDAQAVNWKKVVLTWFTDHTPEGHSRRIIELLGQALDDDELLTREELFVLLAACYLHDLGMQDAIIDGRNIEDMDSSAWQLVRERHPERSEQLIINRTLARLRDEYEIGLPQNSDLLEPIGLVARSHGSRYFEAAVIELEERDFRPSNRPARLGGVAALLLMGDELDLHRVRVDNDWPAEMFELSAVGQLHFHLHSYITRIEFLRGVPTSTRRISLGFTFPAGAENYPALLQEHLARRLLKQIRRTNPVLVRAFDGALTWDDTLAFAAQESSTGAYRELPVPARHQLDLEIATERLVDRKGVRDDLEDALANRLQRSTVVGIKDSPDADTGYVLRWVIALARATGVLPLHLDFSIVAGHDLNDLSEVVMEVVDAALAEFEAEHRLHESEDIQRLLGTEEQQLIDDVAQAVAGGDILLVLQGLTNASQKVTEWAAELLDQIDGATAGVAVIIDRAPALPADARTHSLLNLTQTDISAHLTNVLGYPQPTAEAEATAIFGLGAGMPARVAHEMLQRVTQHVQPCL